MVPEEGIEPSLPCENRILNPARLPIPPLRHVLKRPSIAFGGRTSQCRIRPAMVWVGMITDSSGGNYARAH